MKVSSQRCFDQQQQWSIEPVLNDPQVTWNVTKIQTTDGADRSQVDKEQMEIEVRKNDSQLLRQRLSMGIFSAISGGLGYLQVSGRTAEAIPAMAAGARAAWGLIVAVGAAAAVVGGLGAGAVYGTYKSGIGDELGDIATEIFQPEVSLRDPTLGNMKKFVQEQFDWKRRVGTLMGQGR